MGKKKKLRFILAEVLLITILLINGFLFENTALAFVDPDCLSDQVFFGVWDSQAQTWTTEGKIDYSYSVGLSSVENYVKQGDYTSAKTALLTYYKNRTSRTIDPLTDRSRNTNVAEIASDDIFSCYEYYLGSFTVNGSFSSISFDVLDTVKEAMLGEGKLSFMLTCRKKDTSAVGFHSREQNDNKPTLEVVVDGQTYQLTAIADTDIRAGMYGDTNYGSDDFMYVKDSGIPYDNYTRKGYIKFDISSLPGEPSSANLLLYGKNFSEAEDKDVAVFKILNTTWGENTLTWNNNLGNTFSWQGISTSTDWNLPQYGADSQWLDIVTRFGFMIPMTYEYIHTANESYAYDAIRLMVDFINDKGSDGGYPLSLDAGIRAKNWVIAYHYLVDSTSMDGESNTAILKYVWKMADYLNDSLNYHYYNNWGAIETLGFYFVAVYFPEFGLSSEWINTANARLDQLTLTMNYIDGGFTEATTMYAKGTAHNFYSAKIMGLLNNQTFSETFDTSLQKMAKNIMDTCFPNGMDPQYGDSDYSSYRSFILDVGNTYNNSNLKYFGSEGAIGTLPSYESVIYAEGANPFAVMRSGWQEDDMYMHINAGTSAGAHWHPDNLSMIVYAYGNRLLIDPGRYSYEDIVSANWLRRSTESHNTIEINDTAQGNYTQTVDSWVTNGSYDFFEGHNVEGSFTHYRSVLFLKPKFWIVSDYIKGTDSTNKYQQTWHMMPTADVTLDGTTKKVETNFNNMSNIQIVPADPGDLTATLDSGYYSSGYMTISQADYASYVKNVSGDVTFDTILYPTDINDTSRNVKVTRLTTSPNVSTTIATAIKVEQDYGNEGDIGYYYLSHEPKCITERSFDIYSYNGQMAYVETSNGGSLKSAMLKSGKTLKQNTTNLIHSSLNIEGIGVKWNGTLLEIEGDSLKEDSSSSTAIVIYAPSTTSVTLNGDSIGFTRVGDYIYAVRQTKVEYSCTDDFSSTQGEYGWYYQKHNSGTYSNLPEYDSNSIRWENTGGNTPMIAGAYMIPGDSDDAVLKWVAPYSGVVNINGLVRSRSSYTAGDGVRVKILKNTVQIWPYSGWQNIARDDTIGIKYDEMISVNEGDVLYLVMNKNTTTESDCARWYCYLTLYPGATLFSDDFEDGNANGWTPLTGARWSVGSDSGDYSYFINTTSYNPTGGLGLGEHSLVNNTDYSDFRLVLKGKLGDAVSSYPNADLAVVFNYQDDDNYYYLMLNNELKFTQLFKVISGTRHLLADADGSTDWLADNEYHLISIERDSSTGSIIVFLDNNVIIKGYDSEFNGGQVGVGSYNDMTYFDDFKLIEFK